MANANASSMLDWKSRSLLPRLLYIVQCRNRYRPQDNSIDWWKSYVAEFFAPNGVVRVSVKDMPVFQQPNHSIPTSLTCTEVPYEALPRLFQFKYENGVQEELLFLGNVIESPLPTGGTSIICYQAAEHLVFDEGYSVVQYGHLKVVFNNNLKVQLLEFSVTGYDLHLDHSVIHSELRQLHQLLESRATLLSNLATAPQLEQKALQDAHGMLQSTSQMVKLFSTKMNSYLSFEWSYIQKVLHFMQMADVIGSMHELFHACKERSISPLAALQAYGKVSARPGQGGGPGGLDDGGGLMGMGMGMAGGMPGMGVGMGADMDVPPPPGPGPRPSVAGGGGGGGLHPSPSPQTSTSPADLSGGAGPGPGGSKPSPSLLPPSALHQHQMADLQQQHHHQQQQQHHHLHHHHQQHPQQHQQQQQHMPPGLMGPHGGPDAGMGLGGGQQFLSAQAPGGGLGGGLPGLLKGGGGPGTNSMQRHTSQMALM